MADSENGNAHAPGGLYRVGDQVVDANGVIVEGGAEKADKIDKAAKREAEKQAKEAAEQQAQVASGGLKGILAAALSGTPSTQVATKPHAASQDEQETDDEGNPKPPVGESAAARVIPAEQHEAEIHTPQTAAARDELARNEAALRAREEAQPEGRRGARK